jgi:REP element-mobilizing transposase RayT
VVKDRKKVISKEMGERLSEFFSNLVDKWGCSLKEFDHEIRKKLWRKNFWTRAYCLLTTGGAKIETLRSYIEKQLGNSPPPKLPVLEC